MTSHSVPNNNPFPSFHPFVCFIYIFGLSQSTGIYVWIIPIYWYMFGLSQSTGIYVWIIRIYWYICLDYPNLLVYICLDYPNLLVYMFGLSQSTGIYVWIIPIYRYICTSNSDKTTIITRIIPESFTAIKLLLYTPLNLVERSKVSQTVH